MKILTVLGARPQFIKAAMVSRTILQQNNLQEVIVHTGQHFDTNMSAIFFEELAIPQPQYNLGISGGHHGRMTGQMLEAVERVLLEEKPDWVLVYGDTNSTLAGALAATKQHIAVAHVEAGLRSFNMLMPEEINRIIADRLSTILFCPTEIAVQNLAKEGITKGVENVGDVMFDAALFYREQARTQSKILGELELEEGNFALATCHRAENTDDRNRLAQIVEALAEISKILPVVFPVHPRTDVQFTELGLKQLLGNVRLIDPVSFIDMVALEQAARVILTDSGGVQKEAFFFGVPCITMRGETEWVETIQIGANQLVGASRTAILEAFDRVLKQVYLMFQKTPYGAGNAAQRIVELLTKYGASNV